MRPAKTEMRARSCGPTEAPQQRQQKEQMFCLKTRIFKKKERKKYIRTHLILLYTRWRNEDVFLFNHLTSMNSIFHKQPLVTIAR